MYIMTTGVTLGCNIVVEILILKTLLIFLFHTYYGYRNCFILVVELFIVRRTISYVSSLLVCLFNNCCKLAISNI